MTFLDKIKFRVFDTEVVIYRNIETKKLADEKTAKEYVTQIMKENLSLRGKKIVTILWEDVNVNMADCWVFGKNESETAGAEVSVYLFKEMERYESPAVTAADGLVVLGLEAEELLNR